MLIRELHIINFRNLPFVRTEFAPGLNLIYGSNAQGKTNLLEAIYLLVTGRSFRTTSDREMIPWVRDEYEATLIRARVEKRSGEERFLMTFNQSDKSIFVNGNAIQRLGELIGRINAVLFTPSDLQLVRGNPGLRRRFIDMECCQVSRTYLKHLQRYDVALRQRNALLKQHQRRSGLRDELQAWDVQLAEAGGEIMNFRQSMLANLSEYAAAAYDLIAGTRERLEVRYQPSVRGLDSTTAGEAILRDLRNNVDDDIRRGATSAGPHRDDITFLLDGRDARDYGSQGQQRSCVLATRLAELKFMEESTGELPILLLDDLMSELDEQRKAALFRALDLRLQIFLTATEKQLVLPFATPQKILRVDDGQVDSLDA